MAITFVNAGTASSTNGSAPAPGMPVGLLPGDVMVLAFYSREVTDGTVSLPGTWTQIVNNRTSGGLIAAWWRVYQVGDLAPTITLGGHVTGTSGDTAHAQIAAWRGCDTANPLDITGTPATNAAALNIGPITGISLGADDVVIVLGGKLDDCTSVATLSGDGLTWAEIGEPKSTSGADSTMVWDYAIAGASPVTVTNKTFTVTGGTSVAGKGVMFSLNVLAAVTVTGTQAAETATPNSGTRSIVPAGAQAGDTGTPNGGAVRLSTVGTQATETVTANGGGVVSGVTVTGIQAAVTASANTGPPTAVITGSQTSETATARPGATVTGVTVTGTQTSQTNTPNGGTVRATINGGLAADTATALPGTVTTAITVAGAQASTTTTANVGSPRINPAGTAATDTATASSGAPTVTVTLPGQQAADTGTAQTGTPSVRVAGQQAGDMATTRPAAPDVTVAGAQAGETAGVAAGTVTTGGAPVTVVGSVADQINELFAGSVDAAIFGLLAVAADTARAGSVGVPATPAESYPSATRPDRGSSSEIAGTGRSRSVVDAAGRSLSTVSSSG